MRIRSRPGQPSTSASAWLSTHRWALPALWAVAVCAALAVAAAIWYRYEGRQVVGPLLTRWSRGAQEHDNGLPILHLELDDQAQRALSRERASAFESGLLSGGAAWHPASADAGGATLPVRVRLVGDSVDHWQEGKWSLDVDVGGDASLLGLQSFALRSPALSGYLNGWLYAQALSRDGLPVLQRTFVNLSVNGEGWGVYALQERPNAQFLAARGIESSAIVRLSDSSLAGHPLAFEFDDPVTVELVGSTVGAASDGALDAVRAHVRAWQQGALAPSEAFDVELLARAMAHADLWGADLSLPAGTFYYDPLQARLTPIGDPGALSRLSVDAPLGALSALSDLQIARFYAQEAGRISEPAYLAGLLDAQGAAFERYRAALALEFYPEELLPPWEALSARQDALRDALHPPQTVHAYRAGGAAGAVEIRVANLLRHPVVVDAIQVAGHTQHVEVSWVAEAERTLLEQGALPLVVLRPAAGPVPCYLTLRVPLATLDQGPGALRVVTHLVGVDQPVVVEVEEGLEAALGVSRYPAAPSLDEALQRHPFLYVPEKPRLLALKPGTWQVDGDLVLPNGLGLWASDPVTLTFERGAGLWATGPLILNAPGGAGIHLLPADGSWAGVVVVGAGEGIPSLLRNVEIRATAGSQDVGSGIAFIASAVHWADCRILGSTARRAIGVVGSTFSIVRTEVAGAAADAFAGARAMGRIEQSAFHDVVGNAIVLAEGELAAQGVSFLRVNGVGIAADDGSRVHARGVHARNVAAALASTDASSVKAQDVVVEQAWVAAFLSYLEDLSWGEAVLSTSQVTLLDDSPRALVGPGGSVRLDRAAGAAPPGDLDPALLQRRLAIAAPLQVVHYTLGPSLRLAGYELRTPELGAGESVELVLYWQALAKLGRDYTVFVHLLDEWGQIAGQWDAMPRENAYPTTAWPVGELVDDPRRVPLSPDAGPGSYRIALGMYDLETRDRLPVTGPDGQPVAGGAIELPATVRVR
ncbi:MAG: CotH kinase family protein [Anaerolineae bacterium]|nr:CotH kinase family protein [Anaerolineae bacterium]